MEVPTACQIASKNQINYQTRIYQGLFNYTSQGLNKIVGILKSNITLLNNLIEYQDVAKALED